MKDIKPKSSVSSEYSIDGDSYSIERVTYAVGGEEIDNTRIRKDGEIVASKTVAESGLKEVTSNYEDMESYIRENAEKETSESWGSTNRRLEGESPVGGAL